MDNDEPHEDGGEEEQGHHELQIVRKVSRAFEATRRVNCHSLTLSPVDKISFEASHNFTVRKVLLFEETLSLQPTSIFFVSLACVVFLQNTQCIQP